MKYEYGTMVEYIDKGKLKYWDNNMFSATLHHRSHMDWVVKYPITAHKLSKGESS
jgi:hypothetical protein